jgi:membrane-anchored glycerophosphoryl diester phosphodiesterase (GDPDase)
VNAVKFPVLKFKKKLILLFFADADKDVSKLKMSKTKRTKPNLIFILFIIDLFTKTVLYHILSIITIFTVYCNCRGRALALGKGPKPP